MRVGEAQNWCEIPELSCLCCNPSSTWLARCCHHKMLNPQKPAAGGISGLSQRTCRQQAGGSTGPGQGAREGMATKAGADYLSGRGREGR